MGLDDEQREFTADLLDNRDLVLSMLKYEDALYLSAEGQKIIGDPYMNNVWSLEGGKTIQRKTLGNFGFTSSDASVATYRSIFRHYYKSPNEYDAEILGSVYYMRENRLLYYKTPELKIGDSVPDCDLYMLDGTTTTNLHSVLNPDKITILAGFSTS